MKTKFLMILIILMIIMPSIKVQANTKEADVIVNIGDKVYLDKGTQGFYTIQKKKADGNWTYIIYSIIKYKDSNGEDHVAYCLDPNKLGVGYVQGDVDGYEVELTKLISNEKIWRVIVNGYPYKTPEQLGVETEEDAYIATKRAIYSMVSGYTEQDVRQNYRVGQKSINGQALEDIQRRGEKVITAICNLVNIGNNGTQTIENELKIIKTSEFKEEEQYCYQSYKVQSNVEISKYTITEMLNFPENTKIVDESGQERNSFNSNEEFRVIIDKANFVEDIEGIINISAKCKIYPIYYGTAPEGYQDYAICSGYWDNLYSTTVLNAEKTEEPEVPPEEPKIPDEHEIPEEPELPKEPEIPEEPKGPEEPQEPEVPSEPLPRTGEDEVLNSIICTIIISNICMTILICLIKKKHINL